MTSDRRPPLFSFALLALVVAMPAAAADSAATLPDRAAPCVVCHGRDGAGVEPEIPNLAGQNVPYLMKQLVLFRDAAAARRRLGGESDGPAGIPTVGDPPRREHRSNAAMDRVIENLDDDELRAIARYYAALPCRFGAAGERTVPPETERCSHCHGTRGIANSPGFPNLAGQHREYLARELRLLRAGDRDHRLGTQDLARRSGIMTPQAMLIDDARLEALAAWYAALPCR